MKLIKKIGYNFKDKALFERALTHKSYLNEAEGRHLESYEKLEFLGDAVLEFIITRCLFDAFGDMSEGELTQIRAKIVCESSLEMIAKNLNLGEFLKFSTGEEATGGRTRPSILADAVESLIGAIFLDGGLDEAERFVRNVFKDNVKMALDGSLQEDFKSGLQEYCLKQKLGMPEYKLVHSEGEPHNMTFVSLVEIGGEVFGRGSGRTKKVSEKEAAREALYRLKK